MQLLPHLLHLVYFRNKEDISGFFCYFLLLNCLHKKNSTKSLGGRSGVTISECVDEGEVIISLILRVIYEYFLVSSHFIVILPIESFHLHKSKMRRSVSGPTKITFFPPQAMSRTEGIISTSASPILSLTVCPLDFKQSANKSIKRLFISGIRWNGFLRCLAELAFKIRTYIW